MLVVGEVRTCLLRNVAAAHHTEVVEALRLVPGERVRTATRPIAYAVSPDRVTGVDCGLPVASGARVRCVGTVTQHATVTGGRVLQSTAFTRLTETGTGRRLRWSHYLAKPGDVETIGRFDDHDVAHGFLAPGPHAAGTIDLGALAEQVSRQVQASTWLDQVAPFKSRRTSLRWVLRHGDEVCAEVHVVDGTARTLHLTCAAPVSSVVALCEDLALHDWLLTTVTQIVERSGIGTATGPAVLTGLRSVIDHLLHLWMPGVRVNPELLPVWEALERRPGFTRQWEALVTRIRDQLALHTLETTLRRSRSDERFEIGGGFREGVR